MRGEASWASGDAPTWIGDPLGVEPGQRWPQAVWKRAPPQEEGATVRKRGARRSSPQEPQFPVAPSLCCLFAPDDPAFGQTCCSFLAGRFLSLSGLPGAREGPVEKRRTAGEKRLGLPGPARALAMQTGEPSKLHPGRLGQGVPSWCADPNPKSALEVEDEEAPPPGLLLAAVNLRSSSNTSFSTRALLN